ncbi:MAG TPA: terminase family protein [Allosphingosinicella sp.]|jgi:phage terminase large subunit-like protein|nr:terminase family protein [Allosphingosinicella sp.]
MTMNKRKAWALLLALDALAPRERLRALKRLPVPALRGISEEWWWQAHHGQREPGGDWRIWLLMAGRGFGKTTLGAEWVWARARKTPDAEIALVGGTIAEVGRVMARALTAAARTGEAPLWVPSRGVFEFPSGAKAYAYSAERPEALRGPEHHFAWCDELAKWRHADRAWDNLMLGLRGGEHPRVLVTTTPQPVPLLRRIKALDRLAETDGRSDRNRNLPAEHLAAMTAAYGGTRLGRQELDGELIEDVEGALWTRETMEDGREAPGQDARDAFKRIVVGVDPPASAAGVCGISVCALGADGIFYVLADASGGGLSPDGWARKVAKAAEAWGADRVVAEANQGGDMVKAVLKAVAPGLPLRLVHASRGKVTRAEPVAALFETGEAKLAGRFPDLEDELAGMVTGGAYVGPGSSPDRADAMVWAMTELMARADLGPRVLRL